MQGKIILCNIFSGLSLIYLNDKVGISMCMDYFVDELYFFLAIIFCFLKPTVSSIKSCLNIMVYLMKGFNERIY